MKTSRFGGLGFGLALALGAAGCGNGGDGLSAGRAALSAREEGSIAHMREEEKLARDVYTALSGWGIPFTRIRHAEQVHMDAMATLVGRHGLVDPVAGLAVGDFADAEMQRLHDALVDQGRTSFVAALRAGAEIEELDIADLRAASAETSHTDVASTYANLARGSRNHLRAFVGQLAAQGQSYEPTHLDAASYDAIVSSPRERGGPAAGGGACHGTCGGP